MNKPGYKTTEFYVVIGASALSLAMASGWLTPDQAEVVKGQTAQAIQAGADFVAALTPLVGMVAYVWSRTRVKTS